ncbi:NUDIX hydrolase [Lacinutrix undariae]
MNFEAFLKLVSKIEQLPLPGEVSQLKMSPPFRDNLIDNHKELMKTSRKAGVMALFYPDVTADTKLILILRKTYKGVHSGQVGFPGGKHEIEDANMKITALRETEEEVGVPIKNITVIKTLTQLYIPPSHFTVHPFLGYATKTPNFVKQDSEVEDLIEVSLQDFINDSNVINTYVTTSYSDKTEVPALKLNDFIVWGATAMMLSELKDLLKQVL